MREYRGVDRTLMLPEFFVPEVTNNDLKVSSKHIYDKCVVKPIHTGAYSSEYLLAQVVT